MLSIYMKEPLGFSTKTETGGDHMQDEKIIALYWDRNECAIEETNRKYGHYCHCVANNILENTQDAEECVNDTWLRAWNTMPPQKPSKLNAFLVKITRNLAFDRFKARTAIKRGGGETIMLVLEELEECIPSPTSVETEYLGRELERSIDAFIAALPKREGDLFIRRYFYTETVSQISEKYGLTVSNISVILSRVRQKLKAYLEKEGYIL